MTPAEDDEVVRRAFRREDAEWWRTAVVYEIYPRSFADSDGDGQGDLPGATARLDHVAGLGADAVWVAPWYPSPMADGGYDVSDYRDIDPRYGTLADADAFVARAHELGLRVITDMVANHSSEQHPWFVEALAAEPGSRARDRYFFRDGRGPDGEEPPNNWISAFGGSAWTRTTGADGRPGQWFLHTFAPEQPDLDWDDPEVLEGFDDILRFWLDRGIDGFRVDAAPAMAKAPGLPDATYDPAVGFVVTDWVDSPHWDLESVHELMRRWRSVLDAHSPGHVLVAEAVTNGPDRLGAYLRSDELHLAFDFGYVHCRWRAGDLREVIDGSLAALTPVGAPPTWALSSHDEIRHLSRFGRDQSVGVNGVAPPPPPTDVALGTRRARAAVLLTLALPGGACLYQGEELGLAEVEDLPDDVLEDPVVARSGGTQRGRDGCRVPIPWSGEHPPFGFSPQGTTPWLPQPASWATATVAAQSADPDSMLSLYREAIGLRHALEAEAGDGFAWRTGPDDVLAFDRGTAYACVVNLGTEPVPLDGEPLLSSLPLEDGRLPADAAAWVRTG